MVNLSVRHLAWQDDAACKSVGVEPFYADVGEDSFLRAAKRVCNGDKDHPPCPVKDACLDHALATEERFGVWGGMSPRQRHREATERRRRSGTLGQRRCVICSQSFPGGPNHKVCGRDCEREARRRRRSA